MVYTFRFLFVILLFTAPSYLLCSFVALDFNPANWLLFTSSIGRVISIIPITIIMFLAIVVPKRLAAKEHREKISKGLVKSKWQQKLDEMKDKQGIGNIVNN